MSRLFQNQNYLKNVLQKYVLIFVLSFYYCSWIATCNKSATFARRCQIQFFGLFDWSTYQKNYT